MPDICTELATLLRTVKRPGDFCASGRLELPAPRLMVDGVGQIALPLLPVQAEQLIAVAERAPYGRGADTIVDTNVRRTWQLGPDRVRIDGKHWQATLDHAVAMAAAGLGVDAPVSAEFYKLLVYDKGSFFVSHRDTEKEPGMFATLVLGLPSLSSGGELVVRHKEREAKLDLANDEPSEMTFAAFYADCVHEVLPITAGCRATLIYNLVRGGKGSLRPPEYESETERAVALLRDWGQQIKTAEDSGIPESDDEPDDGVETEDDGVPEKVIYPLEHAYSLAELDFAKLKGADAAVAALLKAAAPQAECDLHLALVSIEETGSADYDGSYRGYRRYHDDDDDEGLEAGEVDERDECLTEWRRADGEPTDLGTLPIEDGEVSPPDALENLKPDEVHFHEATGNAGATFERSYRHAALVLWPRQRRLAVLNQAGIAATLPYIESLVAKWTSEGARQDSTLWAEAHELSGHMLSTWRDRGGYYRDDDDTDDKTDAGATDDKRSSLARLLAALTALENTARIEAVLAHMASQRGHSKHDNAVILGAVALFPPERAAGMIETIVAGHANVTPGGCCALLGAAAAGPFAAGPKRLAAATKTLIASLAGDPARVPPPAHSWESPRRVAPGPGAVASLVRVAEAVDTGLSRELAAYLLAWPKTYGFDDVLIPAVKRLLKGGTPRSGAATVDLLTACLTHLQKRTAESLEAPKNWKRPSSIGCKCEYCSELSGFLADPAAETWTLKARADIRDHVEGKIRTAQADLDVTTVRKGSPHGLVCRKNSASYERRVAQRRKDVADIAVLKGKGESGGSASSEKHRHEAAS